MKNIARTIETASGIRSGNHNPISAAGYVTARASTNVSSTAGISHSA